MAAVAAAGHGPYADWDAKRVRPDHLPFAPQYPLWSDGATKLRWLFLPRGSSIDASNVDTWKFPVGTRLWKEFRFNRRAETRFIERTRQGWRYATYVWNDDESEAVLAPEMGIAQSVETRPGVRHAIPSRMDCRACHEASPVRVLGVGALQLSPDRDPNAPHAEALPTGAVDLTSLLERRLVRGLPRRFIDIAPRINADSPTSRAALGYLHTNCGTCHTAGGELASLSFSLRYLLDRRAGESAPAVATSVGRRGVFRPAGQATAAERVSAGDPDGSMLLTRMASRHLVAQMPPLGTRVVDEAAVQLIRKWITEDLKPGAASASAKDTGDGANTYEQTIAAYGARHGNLRDGRVARHSCSDTVRCCRRFEGRFICRGQTWRIPRQGSRLRRLPYAAQDGSERTGARCFEVAVGTSSR